MNSNNFLRILSLLGSVGLLVIIILDVYQPIGFWLPVPFIVMGYISFLGFVISWIKLLYLKEKRLRSIRQLYLLTIKQLNKEGIIGKSSVLLWHLLFIIAVVYISSYSYIIGEVSKRIPSPLLIGSLPFTFLYAAYCKGLENMLNESIISNNISKEPAPENTSDL